MTQSATDLSIIQKLTCTFIPN